MLLYMDNAYINDIHVICMLIRFHFLHIDLYVTQILDRFWCSSAKGPGTPGLSPATPALGASRTPGIGSGLRGPRLSLGWPPPTHSHKSDYNGALIRFLPWLGVA